MQQPLAERRSEPGVRAHQIAFSRGLNRLLSAAVASSRFGRMLLADPIAAVATGYSGERFHLTPDEFACLSGISANNLREFAAQLVSKMQGERAPADHHAGKERQPELCPVPVQVADYGRRMRKL